MPETTTGGAFKLGMCKQGQEYRDREGHLVIADGALEYGDTLDALWRRILEDVFKAPPGARN